MAAFISGLLGVVFGLGLIFSGMSNPAKVLAFLDIGGAWDPSLAFVMLGASGVAALLFAYAGKRGQSWLGAACSPLEKGAPDRGLIGGSLLFGIGWGLSGFCPGPALVGLGAGFAPAVLFVIAMLLGMAAYERVFAQGKADG
ncbi:MAG: hypothetical protein CVU16_14585 [Betaproteobacteria bacterium HGW-Betaproteobacteria-10]|nr:MAG: hypothetical protein CVU16_14585 [Betaproteobacteria bacterium HGW-Betaproteobacteria-10]